MVTYKELSEIVKIKKKSKLLEIKLINLIQFINDKNFNRKELQTLGKLTMDEIFKNE